MNPLVIALTISMAVNIIVGAGYLAQRDATVQAKAETTQSDSVALACTQGVESLTTQATKRHKEAAPKVEAAKQAADTSNKQADKILSTPAAAPGDDCKSAQDRVDAWWTERGPK